MIALFTSPAKQNQPKLCKSFKSDRQFLGFNKALWIAPKLCGYCQIFSTSISFDTSSSKLCKHYQSDHQTPGKTKLRA